MLQAFFIALGLLTRVPIGKFGVMDGCASIHGQSVLYYPVVGLLIGGLLALVHLLFSDAPIWIQAALLLFIWVTVTGCLHLDGLADSVDGWMGGQGNRERTLAIMKDPHCGSIAVVMIVLVLLLKFAALVSIIAETQVVLYVLLIPMLGRGTVLVLFLTTPYAKPEGMGAMAVQALPVIPALGVIVGVGVICLVSFGFNGFWLLIVGFWIVYFMRRLMMQRIGGTTGDTAGALVELAETAFLVTAACRV